jgi:serpin B
MAWWQSGIIIIVWLIILFSGCAEKQGTTRVPNSTQTITVPPIVTPISIPTDTETKIPTANTSEQDSSKNFSIGNSINIFAFKTYSILSNESGNLFFSPFSVHAALSMMAEGANGSTLEEMDNALALSTDSSTRQQGYEELMNNLNAKNSNYNLSIANAIWIEKTYSVKPEFSDILSTYYDTTAFRADFANNPDAERMNINRWVEGKTNNKILNLIPEGNVDSLTRLVIADAIYFKGKWAQIFEKQNTKEAPFFVSSSMNVTVPLMYQSAWTGYYSDNEVKALEMDYEGYNLSMLILLPDSNHSLSEVESELSSDQINSIRSQIVNTEVHIWIPRFSITRFEKMRDLLIELGMASAFDSSTADFAGINSAKELFISDVFHKTFINVNEFGTEAAAATAVIFAGAAPPMYVKEFRADHPFLFFIMDKQSGAILFMGRVVDPSSGN